MLHHLPTNAVFTIRFQDSKSKDIRMLFFLVILQSNSISSYHNVIVIGELRELGILGSYLHIKASAVFYWESFEIEFSEDIDVLTVDLSHCYFQEFFLFFLLHQYLQSIFIARAFIIQQHMEEEKPTLDQNEFVNFGKFNIFLLTKAAQNSYGIKGGDYFRYRRYCTTKIGKFRKSLNVKYGTKKQFIRKDIIKQKPNEIKILQILLFNAEKNWAFANEQKFSANRKASQKARGRFASIKKFKRAFQWAQKLSQVCKDRTDKTTHLESQAYVYYLEGLLNFEKQDWNNTQIKLIACRQIISDLSKICDSMSQRAFKQKIDQIEQTIKFCNFKLSKGKELSIDEIIKIKISGDESLSRHVESLAEKNLSEISLTEKSSTEVYFGNERYPIKQDLIAKKKKMIDSQISSLEEIKKKSFANVDDEKLYEQLLSFYSDLIVLVEDAIKISNSEREDSKKKTNYTQGQLEILKKISLLFSEIKMKLFIDRNITVFKHSFDTDKGRKSTPQTLAKLLTSTTTLFQELAQIIKEKGQVSNNFDIEDVHVIDGKNFYLRCLRLLFVGQVYFNNDKIKQAFGLWGQCERSLKILISKQDMNQNKKDEGFIGSLVSLDKMKSILRLNRCKCVILNHEIDEGKKDSVQKKMKQVSLNENEETKSQNTLEKLLNEKSSEVNLSLEELSKLSVIELPGKLLPAPTRPIFFDLFYESMSYPNVESKIKPEKGNWWSKLFK